MFLYLDYRNPCQAYVHDVVMIENMDNKNRIKKNIENSLPMKTKCGLCFMSSNSDQFSTFLVAVLHTLPGLPLLCLTKLYKLREYIILHTNQMSSASGMYMKVCWSLDYTL